mmetsp:Transcript_64067/g.105761  ORF Transcript_64067/g.105761 Transcript_64067/m.105761 type:complete len:307 (+) Transcript_64067:4302-5222(+)
MLPATQLEEVVGGGTILASSVPRLQACRSSMHLLDSDPCIPHPPSGLDLSGRSDPLELQSLILLLPQPVLERRPLQPDPVPLPSSLDLRSRRLRLRVDLSRPLHRILQLLLLPLLLALLLRLLLPRLLLLRGPEGRLLLGFELQPLLLPDRSPDQGPPADCLQPRHVVHVVLLQGILVLVLVFGGGSQVPHQLPIPVPTPRGLDPHQGLNVLRVRLHSPPRQFAQQIRDFSQLLFPLSPELLMFGLPFLQFYAVGPLRPLLGGLVCLRIIAQTSFGLAGLFVSRGRLLRACNGCCAGPLHCSIVDL